MLNTNTFIISKTICLMKDKIQQVPKTVENIDFFLVHDPLTMIPYEFDVNTTPLYFPRELLEEKNIFIGTASFNTSYNFDEISINFLGNEVEQCQFTRICEVLISRNYILMKYNENLVAFAPSGFSNIWLIKSKDLNELLTTRSSCFQSFIINGLCANI